MIYQIEPFRVDSFPTGVNVFSEIVKKFSLLLKKKLHCGRQDQSDYSVNLCSGQESNPRSLALEATA